MQYISESNDPKPGTYFIYDNPPNPKISLSEGKERFKECMEFLYYMKPLTPLTLCEPLTVKVPKTASKWSKREIFADLLGEKKANLAEHYTNYQFHFDIGSPDAEISAIMQIVDDNHTFKGSRRENILSKTANLVGISSHKSGKKNCTYILFAKSNSAQ